MPSTIFVTGASGFIGGSVLGPLIEKHPDLHVAVSVRNKEQAEAIHARWPLVKAVVATLDDKAAMVSEASKADVVLQLASSDHVAGVQALIEGLSRREGGPGHFIHISGTGVLNDVSNGFGQPSPKTYDDMRDLDEMSAFDNSHLHHDVDDAVMAAGKQFGVSTAIVCPPTIYGVGKGPLKTRSIQIPYLVESILKHDAAFVPGKGKNIWDHVHISDLASAFILLVEEALKPMGGAATWGPEGYYFCEAGEHTWHDVAVELGKILHERGAINSPEAQELTADEVSAIHPWGTVLWGGNCRSRASRLRTLGWRPVGPKLVDELPAMCDEEIRYKGKSGAALTFDV